MSQMTGEAIRAYPSSAALVQYRRVKMSGGILAYASSTEQELGCVDQDCFVADGLINAPVRLRTAQGTQKFVAVDAITAFNPFYAASNGKVSASGTVLIGISQEATTTDGDVFEGLRRQETSDSAAAGGTTAAAFEVDSDSAIPKIALASYVGGAGDYTTTLKPEATLSADNTITVPEADGDVLAAIALAQTLTNKTLSTGTKDLRPATTLTPDAANGAGATMTAGLVQYTVAAVTNDANDWVTLPAIAGVAIGHTIRILCNAGGNFELRTPASSNTTINGQDADGTKEYLCTDTDMVVITKASTTNWIAQSITTLGAVRTAVVPD